jgi:NADH-quinone oxidoreductase subunit N
MNIIILTSLLGILTLFLGVFDFRKFILPVVSLGLLFGLGILVMEWGNIPAWYAQYDAMIHWDRFSMAFSGVLIFITLFLFNISDHFYKNTDQNKGDIYALMLFVLCGGVIMTSYNNLTMLFLGIEILSISLYILAGSRKFDLASNEASIKYFLTGSFSTGFLLFGIALIYGTTKSFNIDVIRDVVSMQSGDMLMFNIGTVLVLSALIFKISAAPFHFWAPDVYQGSPSMITAFMSTVGKTAGFAALFRFCYYIFSIDTPASVTNTLMVVAGLTIVVGNLSAFPQKRVKRMLAFSSISNAGYMLIGLTAFNGSSDSSILYYALAYSIATIIAFIVMMYVVEQRGNDDFGAFNGVGRTNPILGFALALSMLSLAGIPPLAGFIAKYYIFRTALESNHFWIVMLAIINSLIGVYYYFNLMVSVFKKEEDHSILPSIKLARMSQIGLVAGILLLLGIGLFPDFIMNLLNPMVVVAGK